MQCRAREERPGRKTDLLDAEWLVHLLECGLLRGWLIPPADIKAARDVIRYRRKLVEHRTSKLQRLGNVLQDAGIKADSVASSVTPKSVRAMVEALIDGERRPAVLADLARGSMRSKIPDLQRALEGRFDDHHALMCRLHLAHLDHDVLTASDFWGGAGSAACQGFITQLGRNFQVIYEQANAHGQKVQAAGNNMAQTDSAVGSSWA